jgi:hypothetical protein
VISRDLPARSAYNLLVVSFDVVLCT